MATYSDKFVVSDIQASLSMLQQIEGASSRKTMLASILRTLGREASKKAKKEVDVLQLKRTGAMRKSIKGKLTRKKDAVIVTPWVRRDGKIYYGQALARGTTIKSLDAKKPLTFKTSDGHWVRKHEVVIRGYDFIDTPLSRWSHSAEFRSSLDKATQGVLKSIEKRNAKKRSQLS